MDLPDVLNIIDELIDDIDNKEWLSRDDKIIGVSQIEILDMLITRINHKLKDEIDDVRRLKC